MPPRSGAAPCSAACHRSAIASWTSILPPHDGHAVVPKTHLIQGVNSSFLAAEGRSSSHLPTSGNSPVLGSIDSRPNHHSARFATGGLGPLLRRCEEPVLTNDKKQFNPAVRTDAS